MDAEATPCLLGHWVCIITAVSGHHLPRDAGVINVFPADPRRADTWPFRGPCPAGAADPCAGLGGRQKERVLKKKGRRRFLMNRRATIKTRVREGNPLAIDSCGYPPLNFILEAWFWVDHFNSVFFFYFFIFFWGGGGEI